MRAGYKCKHASVDPVEEENDAAAGMGSGD